MLAVLVVLVADGRAIRVVVARTDVHDAASRAAHESYAVAALAADHRAHVDVNRAAADQIGAGLDRDRLRRDPPEWANRRESGR